MPDTDAGVDAGATDAGATDAGTADASVPDTWSNFGQTFFATYCVACHSGGLRDYRTITQVQRDFAHVRCGVSAVARTDCGGAPAPRQFPAGSGVKPTDPERARLVAWIDSGLAP